MAIVRIEHHVKLLACILKLLHKLQTIVQVNIVVDGSMINNNEPVKFSAWSRNTEDDL